MNYDPKGKAPQKRRISPEAGESSSSRPAPRAFEDAQVAQVTESFGNLGTLKTSHSQAQGYGPPPAATSSYQSTAETANLIFSADGDSCIISTVAGGWTFDQIKDEFFPHLDNVTPWLLESRAQTLGAFWLKWEDGQLRNMVLGQREPFEVLAPIRDKYFSSPCREVWDIQVRYNLLKGWHIPRPTSSYAQAGESSQAQQYSAFNNQPSSPAYPESHPSYTSAAPSYDSVQEAHRPIFPTDLGHPERRTCEEAAETRDMLKANLFEIKEKLAMGWKWHQIQEKYCPQYMYDPMRKFLKRQGCHLWTIYQSQQLYGLRLEGNDWPEICDKLMSPRRTEQEAEIQQDDEPAEAVAKAPSTPYPSFWAERARHRQAFVATPLEQ
ncbi:hypothetical protein LA080_001522 [Diaporthe eres]|nr:hypothetical protein LA080_001522 [Diaporthe eres]